LREVDGAADQGQALFSADNVDDLPPTIYPIDGFDQLLTVIGADSLLSVRGAQAPAKEARPLIPPYYFPISNAADFKSKLADLAELGPLSEMDLYEEWAQRAGQVLPPAPTDCWS
jgi:hypothetical protein